MSEPIRITMSLDDMFSHFRERHRAALLERCAKSSVTVCPRQAQDDYMRDLGMVYDWLTDLFQEPPPPLSPARQTAIAAPAASENRAQDCANS